MYQTADSLDRDIDIILETYPSQAEENKTPSLEAVDEERKRGVLPQAADNHTGFDLNLE